MCRDIFRVQAHALGLFFDEMVNTFDPDALIVGGGAIETGREFQDWFLDEIRAGMPAQRKSRPTSPFTSCRNGDTAGSRGCHNGHQARARRRTHLMPEFPMLNAE